MWSASVNEPSAVRHFRFGQCQYRKIILERRLALIPHTALAYCQVHQKLLLSCHPSTQCCPVNVCIIWQTRFRLHYHAMVFISLSYEQFPGRYSVASSQLWSKQMCFVFMVQKLTLATGEHNILGEWERQ